MGFNVVIPHKQLAPEVLRAVIEDFVTREGTDYGPEEHSLEQKHDAVRKQLDGGEAFIVFDPEHETLTLLRREQLPAEMRNP
jgi:uncharacterized protein YheU (UPF0270 family)